MAELVSELVRPVHYYVPVDVPLSNGHHLVGEACIGRQSWCKELFASFTATTEMGMPKTLAALIKSISGVIAS